MSDTNDHGQTAVQVGGRAFRATWRVVDNQVEVTSEFGVQSAPLGLLRSAPGTVAREKLSEMARRGTRAPKKASGPSLPTLREMMRWKP